jgi:hypothetical protein
MVLRKRGKYWYGDSQADIRGELIRYGKLDDEVPTQFKDVRCTCGSTNFRLQMDEEQGAAIRTCTSCGAAHAIADSDEYLSGANLDAACVHLRPRGHRNYDWHLAVRRLKRRTLALCWMSLSDMRRARQLW